MERGSITKWLLLAVAIFVALQFGPKLFGKVGAADVQPLTVNDQLAPAPEQRPGEELCTIDGGLFRAELSTKGGSLKHFVLTDQRYAHDGRPLDLVTTSRESRMPLRTDLRFPGGAAPQVAYDDFDWKL